jgi:hypothetical protein
MIKGTTLNKFIQSSKMTSDPYTGDPAFEATPVESPFPPPFLPPRPSDARDGGPPPKKQKRGTSPRGRRERHPDPQRPPMHRVLSSPKMAIGNLLYRSDPSIKMNVNWCECDAAQRWSGLSPDKELVLRLVQVRYKCKRFDFILKLMKYSVKFYSGELPGRLSFYRKGNRGFSVE